VNAFTAEERARVRGGVLEPARANPRVDTGADVGSLAGGGVRDFRLARRWTARPACCSRIGL